jgi:hypothetical protein
MWISKLDYKILKNQIQEENDRLVTVLAKLIIDKQLKVNLDFSAVLGLDGLEYTFHNLAVSIDYFVLRDKVIELLQKKTDTSVLADYF